MEQQSTSLAIKPFNNKNRKDSNYFKRYNKDKNNKNKNKRNTNNS